MQKFIENKDFRQWNKFHRDIDKSNLELEIKQLQEENINKKKIRELNKIKKAIRLLFNGFRPRLNLTPEQRKLRKKEYNKIWNENNPAKLKAMRRRRLERHREKIYTYLKKWRASNLDKSRLKQRLTYWRGQQAKLAEQELEFSGYESCTNGLDDSFSTFGLSDQLRLFIQQIRHSNINK